MFENKENLILDIEDFDMQALGISHKDNTTYFVENAIPNEKVEAKIVSLKKSIAKAKCIKILKKSEFRTTPLCPYFLECGGCDTQHIEYLKTLEFKKNQIYLLLKKIANINFKDDIEMVESNDKYFYRNKLSMKIAKDKDCLKLCFYKKNSHTPVFSENCYIVNKKFENVINIVNEFLKSFDIKPFNETKKVQLKHFVARMIDDGILITFVVNKKTTLNVENLYNKLKENFKNVGINININNNDKEILSNNFIHLKGDAFLVFDSFGIKQKINNASFLQVNPFIQDRLYEYVIKNVSGTVINAFSGAGLLTCLISKSENVDKVIGIEINKEATILANNLVKENKILNVENLCGDANKLLSEFSFVDYTLVLDPPRSGIDKNMISSILLQKPTKIIYISCSLNSLCNNLKELCREYNIEKIKGFDMFPQTKNLETVVILKRKD